MDGFVRQKLFDNILEQRVTQNHIGTSTTEDSQGGGLSHPPESPEADINLVETMMVPSLVSSSCWLQPQYCPQPELRGNVSVREKPNELKDHRTIWNHC